MLRTYMLRRVVVRLPEQKSTREFLIQCDKLIRMYLDDLLGASAGDDNQTSVKKFRKGWEKVEKRIAAQAEKVKHLADVFFKEHCRAGNAGLTDAEYEAWKTQVESLVNENVLLMADKLDPGMNFPIPPVPKGRSH